MSDPREWPESWLETPDGKRYPITDSVVVGRSPDLLICLEDGERTVARRHCVLRRLPSGGVELEDLGSTNGTIVNGRKISREPLFDGDVLTLGTFRLTFHGQAAPPPAPPDELKQRVAEAPEVTERWLVWADALCERGDPRGEYLNSRPGPQSLGSQLDLLVRDHDLLLTWRLGHVATAQFFELTAEVLTALLSHPLVEFITELQLPTLGKWRTVLSAAPLPALRELRIGPLFSAQTEAIAHADAASLRLQAPRLTSVQVVRVERAWLSHPNGSDTPLGLSLLTLGACTITWEGSHWSVRRVAVTGSAMFINGVSRFSRVLRHGDVIRMGHHTATFCTDVRPR